MQEKIIIICVAVEKTNGIISNKMTKQHHRKLKSVYFVVSCKDNGATLGACLQSIYSLRYPQTQIKISVIAKNSSRTNIRNVLQQYPEVFSSPALSDLFEKVTEDLIAFVDSDIVLAQNWAIQCTKAIDGVGIAATGCPIYQKGVTQGSKQQGIPIVLNTKAFLIKRNDLKEIGLFDQKIKDSKWAGFDLACKLLKRGRHIFYTNKTKAHKINQSKNFFHLLLTMFYDGYFSAEVMLKHKIPVTFKTSIANILSKDLKSYVGSNLTVMAMRSAELTGFLASWIKRIGFLTNSNGSSLEKISHATYFLSDEGNIYGLSPFFGVFLQEENARLINLSNCSAVPLMPHQEKLLKDAICNRLIPEQINPLISNKFFIPIRRHI